MSMKAGRKGVRPTDIDWRTGKVKGGGGLTPATADTLGGVKIGSGINVEEDGTISVNEYTLPTASANTKGGVKIGNGINVTEDGTISANGSVGNVVAHYTQDVSLNQTGDFNYNVAFDVASYDYKDTDYNFIVTVEAPNSTIMSYIVPQGFAGGKVTYSGGYKWATIYAMLWQMATVGAQDPTATVHLYVVKLN